MGSNPGLGYSFIRRNGDDTKKLEREREKDVRVVRVESKESKAGAANRAEETGRRNHEWIRCLLIVCKNIYNVC